MSKMGWSEFIAAMAVFFLSHSVPVRPRVRARIVEVWGGRSFTVAYSVLSLGVLSWVISAAGRAPYVPLWLWAPWQNTFVFVAMGVVCLLLALSIGRPNPFSFGGSNNAAFDPARPGVVRITRHPLLVALGLWAFAHVIPNGDLAHVILFGIFGGFAFLGQAIIDRRKQRQMGDAWHALKAEVAAGRVSSALRFSWRALLGLAIAVVLYGFLIGLHPWLFGVSPIL